MNTDIINKITRFRGFTLVGFIRYFVMKFRKKQLLVTGSCNCCGSCCEKLSLDDGRGWIRNEAEFKAIVAKHPEYGCFTIIGYDSSGIVLFRCSHISSDGKCEIYQERFRFCKDFPDKNLLFCGGGLPLGCGYQIESVVPFNRILKETIDTSNEKDPYS
ncbi:hypothetical protein [Desulforhopalus sp. 52FAK]